jgi:cell wall-associated NlpC family hydrolase
MIRARIIAEARNWIGTPFNHQGRVRGVGVDCAGLVIRVAQEVGLPMREETGYSPIPDGVGIMRSCDEQMRRIDGYTLGDVVLFSFGPHPQHLGIVGDYPGGGLSLIHAYAPVGRVVETGFDAIWQRRTVQAYRYPGVE